MKHNWGDTTMDGHEMSFWVAMRSQRPVTPAFDRLVCRRLLKGVSLNKLNVGYVQMGVAEFDKLPLWPPVMGQKAG